MEWAVCSVLVVALAGTPADDRAKAQEEIDQQMKQLVVKIPPPQVEVIFAGVDKPVFELEDAHFSLDDESLGTGEVSQINAQGPKTLYSGPVDPGPHQLTIKLVYHRNDVSLFSGLRTFKYRIESSVPLRADKGLALHVRLSLHVDDKQEDPKKQLKFSSEVRPVMLEGLDDSPLPELAAAKKAAAAQPVAPPPRVEADPVPPPAAPAPEAQLDKPPRSSTPKSKAADPVELLRKKLKTDPVQIAQAGPAPAAPASTAAVPLDAGAPLKLPADSGIAAAPRAAADAGLVVEPAPESNLTWLWVLLGALGVVAVAIGLGRRRRRPFPDPD